MRNTSWGKDNGTPSSVIHLDSSHPGYVVVPDAQLLFTADLHRSGSNLVLTGQDGRHFVIPGYFSTETPPALIAPSGASLAPDLISLLTGSPTPNEYAQAQSPTPPGPIGKVEKIIGTVDVIRNGVAVTPNVGDNVYNSDVVQTGANSSVGIGFPDGTALNLVANTRMALNEYSYDANSTSNEALFSLVEGTFSFVAGKVAHAGDMKIGTPVATLGIRGTVGWVMEDQAPAITANAGNVSWHFAAAYDSITNQQSVYTLFAIDPNCDPIQGLSCNLTALTTVNSDGGLVTSLTSNGIGAPPTITTGPPDAIQAQFERFAIPQVVNTAVQANQQFQQNNNQQNNPNQTNPQSNGTNGSTTPPGTLNLDGADNPNNNNNNNNNNNGENGNPLPQTLNTSPPIILASLPNTSSPSDTVVIPPPEPHAPTLAIASTTLSVNVSGAVALGIAETPFYAGDPVSVTISGIPTDATLSNSEDNTLTINNGSITLTPAQLPGLMLHMGTASQPATLTVTATEEGASVTENITVTVNSVPPVLGGATSTTVNEGGLVTLAATDTLGTVTITGLSNDLTNFNGGSYTASTGTWTGTAAQFDALTFKAGEDGVQHLTITAATTGAEAGSSSENYTLTVNPVAEGPVFGGAVATSAAEQGGVVTLGATVAAADSDDTLGTVTITGLSNDLTNFNGGSYTSSTGTWSGTAAQFDALTFKAGEDGVQHLTITAATTGAEAGSTTENYTLTVNPVAEGPVLGGAISATVGQGGVVTLGATDTVSDADDALGSVTITGLPGDLTSFSGGSYTASSGTWSGTAAQFNALTFNAGGPGTFALSISASTTGAEAGSSSESYTLTVSNIGPLVSGTIGTANEGGTVALGLTDAVRDAGDTLGTVTITGLSNDLTNFNGGSYTASTGTWTGTATQFNALTFTAGEDGSHNITISATESGVGGGTTTANYTLTVNPVAEGPVFGGAVAASAAEQGGVVTLGATVAAADSDDTLGTVTITGLSNDLTNFNGGSYTASTGTWSGTAAQFDALTFKAGEDGVQHLTITAATTGAEAGSTTENYTLTVNPVAEGPVLGGAISATVGQGGVVTLGATDTVSDADDALGSVTITGLPGDLTSFSGGSYTASSGTWSGTAAQFNALTFNAGGPGTFALSISASTTGAEAGSSSESYTLTVSNIGPLVSGTIGTANEGGTVALGLTDAVRDAGDTLGTVTITGLSNDLTNFNGGSYTASTGTWTGTATQFNALTFTAGEDGSHNITISATESGVGGGTTTANYTLTVNPVAEGPVLGGAISATVGQGGVVTLGATDTVSDADDALGSVTITGLPGDLTSFSGGSYTASSGTWSGTAAQFNALTFNAGGPGTFALSISASTTGAEAGSSSESYTLTVSNIGPLVSGTIGTANEGATVALGLTDAVRDAGDTLGTVTITGLSNDLTNFNGGSYTASSGTWTGTATQFNALTFTAGEDGSHNITISATESGVGGGTTTANYTLTVNPVAEGPVLGGAISATVGQGGVVTLGATDTVSDADDALGSVTITGLPGDLTSFSGGSYTASSGTWSGTAAQFNALTFNAGGPGTFALSISASTTGAEAGSSSESYTLTVSNIGPLVSGTIGTANEGATVTLGLTDAVRDAGDTLGTVTITGLSNDLTNFNGGSYTASSGTWTGTATQFNALTFTAGEDGSHNITISATESGVGGGTTTANYTLTVNPVAEGPVFGGAVAASAAEQGGVVTLGATVAAADSDDTLGTVTITGLSNDLTNFNGGSYTSSTGTWSGTAAQFDALTFKAGVRHFTSPLYQHRLTGRAFMR